ncbi:hypothetical protein MP638_002573 [Amoeboaphelidium occidentale]|nr:hypothetical protein MP638_002573 [Amoeboaphelidium occidentale]
MSQSQTGMNGNIRFIQTFALLCYFLLLSVLCFMMYNTSTNGLSFRVMLSRNSKVENTISKNNDHPAEQSDIITEEDTFTEYTESSNVLSRVQLLKSCVYLTGQTDQWSDSRLCDFTASSSESLYTRGSWLKTCDASIVKDPVMFAYKIPQNSLYKINGQFNTYLSFGKEAKNKSIEEIERKKKATMYTYLPSQCVLKEWDREDGRKLLSRRKSLFLGDSIMDSFATSVSYLTGTEQRYFRSYVMVDDRTWLPMPQDQFAFCECMTENYLRNTRKGPFTSNDFSKCKKLYKKTMGHWHSVCYPPKDVNGTDIPLFQDIQYLGWVKELMKSDTLIFSFGHHMYKLGELNTTYPAVVERMIKWFEDLKWSGTLIYVATPPGHPGCFRKTEPENQESSYSAEADIYNWRSTYNLQFLWREAFQKSEKLRNRSYFLDLSHMLQRPDAHYIGPKKDCLHWVIPGPIDTWSQFLIHLFKQIDGY